MICRIILLHFTWIHTGGNIFPDIHRLNRICFLLCYHRISSNTLFAVRNMGYMGATVHLDKKTRKNKLKLAYRIHAGHPYKVRHVVYDIDDLVISDYMRQDSAQSLLAPGMLFDVNVLDAERQRITK